MIPEAAASMRVGVVQLTSTDDLAANLATAERLVRKAAVFGKFFLRRGRI